MYAADLDSCIWKALGFVLRLIHTDYAKYYIAGHWKTGPKEFPAWGATPPTHTLEKHWGGLGPRPPPPTGPDAYELLKTPCHRLVWGQNCGIVWVKEEGSWRDLEICASPKVGGAETSLPPPSLESGGGEASAPLPPYSYALWTGEHIR